MKKALKEAKPYLVTGAVSLTALFAINSLARRSVTVARLRDRILLGA